MNKTLKNVINKTIKREFRRTEPDFREDLKKDIQLNHEYAEIGLGIDELEKKLKEVLSKEQQELLEKIMSLVYANGFIESEVAFKQGVILGVTELNYLNEVGIEIAFI